MPIEEFKDESISTCFDFVLKHVADGIEEGNLDPDTIENMFKDIFDGYQAALISISNGSAEGVLIALKDSAREVASRVAVNTGRSLEDEDEDEDDEIDFDEE